MNRKYNKWTDEQIDFVLQLREKGMKWNAISRRIEQVYSIKRTGRNISAKISAIEETAKENTEDVKMKIPENYEPATKKQCRYYALLTSSANVSKEELNRTTELLYGNALKGLLGKSFLQKAIAELIIDEKIKERSVVKAKGRGNLSSKKWSEDEVLTLLNCMYECEVNQGSRLETILDIANTKFDNRTVISIKQKWTKLKRGGPSSDYTSFKRQKMIDVLGKVKTYKNAPLEPKVEDLPALPENIEVFVEKQGNPTTRHLSNDENAMLNEVKEVLETIPDRKYERSRYHWKTEEEFDLLCNFYELSIDEARNQFGRSYASLAQRLEMIVDSEEPEHIDMLKKAAKVIAERKKAEAKNANMSRWKRRRIARKAKKAAKLEKKLSKLRGV